MRLPLWGMVLALVVAFVCAMGAAAFAQGSGNINVFLGAKALDEDDWAPLDEHSEAGFEFDFRGENWPVSIAIDILHSSSDEEPFLIYDPYYGNVIADVKAETTEFDIGVRKVWEPNATMRPFLGGGLAMINGEITASSMYSSESVDDTGTGLWLDGGIYWTIGGHFNLGFEARISTATINLEGFDFDAGGGHFGLLLGYHF